MKKHACQYFLLLATAFCLCNTATAQIPVDAEPHHTILLQNKWIRVLYRVIPPDDTAAPHLHAANSVIVFLSKSRFGIQATGEAPVFSDVSPGDTRYVTYGDKPVIHSVWNQGAVDFNFLVVELRRTNPRTHTASILQQPGVTLQFREKLVNVYDVRITKEKPFRIPASSFAYLLINISDSIHVVNPGTSKYALPRAGAFFPPQIFFTITNNANEPGQCILLQFK